MESQDHPAVHAPASTPGAEALSIDPEIRRIHGRLSSTGERFLEYVEEHPEAAERARYAVLDTDTRGVIRRLQTWPFFLDARAQQRCAEAIVGIARLVRLAPHRVFQGDADRLASWYALDQPTARLAARLLADPEHLAPMVARGDFIDTEEGFACVELNVAANLGGWTSGLWERLYLQAPPLREFVRNEGLDFIGVDPLDTFFLHALEVTAAAGLDGDGELNLVLAMPEETAAGAAEALQSYADERYQVFLKSLGGTRGELAVCTFDALEVADDGRVTLEGRRVHLLLESFSGTAPQRVFTASMLGRMTLLNGPVGRVLNDRRSLALLSEHGDSELFSDEEREVVRRRLPWTRVVADRDVVFRGRRARLPDLLVAEQDALVLKHVESMSGDKVLIGATTEPERWRNQAEEALAEGAWIVQERVQSLTYACQHGPGGWAPHDAVWGFFAFGDRYGGGFVRVMPQGGSGVVNSGRGADDGAFFVVEEAF